MTSRVTEQLPPDARSAAAARRLVRDLLHVSGHEAWVEAAELAVSEVVTNAVLHAHTPVTVTAQCNGELRVEVVDGSPALPRQRQYGEQATTGRGMGLVASITQEHGVTPLPDGGKVVWFVINRELSADADTALSLWAVDVAGLEDAGADRSACVRLLGLPSTLWLAAQQRHDAVLRELALLRTAAGQSADDLAAADSARAAIHAAVDRAVAQARAEGRARSPLPENHPARLEEVPPGLDLEVEVAGSEAAAAFAVLQDVLDEAERLAVDGRMLARPGLPEVVALRDWVCEQVISQVHGLDPSPWPGTDSERFTEHDSAWQIDWDTRQVSESTRGAVAADDGNRIIAISRPLADELGWAPEDLVGRRVVAIVPPRFREAHVAGFTRHLTTGEAHALEVDLELPVLRADATEVLCSFFIEAHRTPSGRAVYVSWVTPKA